MVTAVDTNVLIDVFRNHPKFGLASVSALRRCVLEGQIVVCGIVWAEVTAAFPSAEASETALRTVPIGFSPMAAASAALAGDKWRLYRSRGGKRDRRLADFLIGAHAIKQCDRLLTRDRGFFRNYFEELDVMDPGGA